MNGKSDMLSTSVPLMTNDWIGIAATQSTNNSKLKYFNFVIFIEMLLAPFELQMNEMSMFVYTFIPSGSLC